MGSSGWANGGVELVNERDHNTWPWPHSSHGAKIKSRVTPHGWRSPGRRPNLMNKWSHLFFQSQHPAPTLLTNKLIHLQIGAFDNKSIMILTVCFSPCGLRVDVPPFELLTVMMDLFIHDYNGMGLHCLAVLIYVSITLYCLDISGKLIFHWERWSFAVNPIRIN